MSKVQQQHPSMKQKKQRLALVGAGYSNVRATVQLLSCL
jgi:hypothetical protein